jgi:hypothetical protein|tara:strand:+ start:492 stop:743 length:252 start_codon:yes stop_codon:yes gene_type:complete
MKLLTVFILTGSVDSTDEFFATVSLQAKAECVSAQAVLPLHAFPCKIKAGDLFHVLKETEDSIPILQCGEFKGTLNQKTEDSK